VFQPGPATSQPVVIPETAAVNIRFSDATSWTFGDDGEPDSDYPEPVPGQKGIRVDEKITSNTFDGDLNRYLRGNSRILKAIMHTEQEIKSQHAEIIKEHPQLRTHWRKFLRWIQGIVQQEDENPAQFYGRLRKRASAGRTMVRQGEGSWVQKTADAQQIVKRAQEIWGTFGSKLRQSNRADNRIKSKDKDKGEGRSLRSI